MVPSATFHWIADHRTLFANLAAVLRPGGRISAQCGGAGNIASVVLGAHLEEVAEAERPDFVRAVASRLPGPTIDHVRLNLVARLAGLSG